jgi:hypothetical protein
MGGVNVYLIDGHDGVVAEDRDKRGCTCEPWACIDEADSPDHLHFTIKHWPDCRCVMGTGAVLCHLEDGCAVWCYVDAEREMPPWPMPNPN